MDDQIHSLQKKGINAVTINSSLSDKEREKIKENITGYSGIKELLKLQKLIKKRIYKNFVIPELNDFENFKLTLKTTNFVLTDAKKILEYISKLNLFFEVEQEFSEFKELLTIIQEKQLRGPVKLLYLAPETLLNSSVIEFINENIDISFIAIDEAHIISQWGMSFRPTYAKLGKIRELLKPVPILALTATADDITRKDILKVLEFQNFEEYVHPIDRPNISYTVIQKEDQFVQLHNIINKYPKDTCGIIYCFSREKAEIVKNFLNVKGITCEYFHARLTVAEKKKIQLDYIEKRLNLIVATVAFGMGIDRSDVRYVINMDIPNSLEEFSQMSGRASRDGKPADSYLLYSLKDATTRQWKLRKDIKNPDRLSLNISKLKQMMKFCLEQKQCRRKILLQYFNNDLQTNCGNCDICIQNL